MNFWATLAVTLVALATASIIALSASGGADALYFEGTYLGSPASLWVNATSGTGKLAITAEGVSYILVSAGLEAYTVYTTDPVSCEYKVGGMGFVVPEAMYADGAFSFEAHAGEKMVFGTPVAAGSDSIPVPSVSECGAARQRQLNQQNERKLEIMGERDLGSGMSARDLWQASQAAYGSRRELGGVPNPQEKNPPPGWSYVSGGRISIGNAQGCVLKKDGQEKYIAGYAGTDGINLFSSNTRGDWADNLNLGKTCVGGLKQRCWQSCSQHCSGWWRRRCRQSCRTDCVNECPHGKNTYAGSYTYMNKLASTIKSKLPRNPIWVVGHSLGGGAATLFQKFAGKPATYGVASFGAPPTSGDGQACSVKGYRFFDNSDPIVGSIGVFGAFQHDVQNAVKCGEPDAGCNWWTLCIVQKKLSYRCEKPGGSFGNWGCQTGSEWGCDWWALGINCLTNFASVHTSYHSHVAGYGNI